MSFLPLLAFALTIASGCVVGARLLWIGRRTRRVPELAIGAASLTQGLGAIPILVGARLSERAEGGALLYSAGWLVMGAGTVALAFGVARIFRPQARWAQGLWMGLGAVTLLAGALLARQSDPVGAIGSSASGLFLQLGRLLAFGWAAVECLAYATKLRRRLRLGLADPVIAHQIQLWGIATGALAALAAYTIWSNFVLGVRPVLVPVGLVVISVLGSTGAVGIWLAFFPPEAYRRRVAGRAAP